MRRWLLWGGGALLALMLVAVLGVTWLLQSGGGRDFALNRLVSALPEGALRWERAEGRLAGPLVLHGLHFTGEDGLDVRIRRVELDARLRALLGRRVDVHRLLAEGVDVRLAPADLDASAEPFEWPSELPEFELPVSIEIRDLGIREARIASAEGEHLVAIGRLDAVGRFGDARLALDRLDIRSDRGDLDLQARFDSAARYDTDLSGSLRLPPPEPGDGASGARFDVQLQGDLDALRLEAQGETPGALSLVATLSEGSTPSPTWMIDLQAEEIDLRLFGVDDPEPVAVALVATGQGLQPDAAGLSVNVEGRVVRDGLAVDLLPSMLAWSDDVVRLEPLAIGLFDGVVRSEGQVGLAGEDPQLDVVVDVDGLRYRADPADPVLVVDGRISLAGVLSAWQVQGGIDVERDGERARLELDGEGDAEALRVQAFRADVPGGQLAGSAEIGWAPVVRWDAQARLTEFDPGYFAPDFSGRINAAIRSEGQLREDEGLDARVVVEELGGQLRGRALSGRAAVDWRGDRGGVDIDLGVGGSAVSGGGTVGDQLGLAFRFDPLRLDDLLPDTGGVLRGELGLQGPAQAPDVQADLTGSELRYGGIEVQALRVRGDLPGSGQRGSLLASLQDVVVGGMALDTVEAQVEGSLAAAEVGVQLRGDPGALELSTDVQRDGERIAGQLRALRYAPPRGAEWMLDNPAAYRVDGGALALERACLAAAAARLCVQADWPGTAQVEGRDIPLAMLEPWLTEDGLEFRIDGLLDLDAELAQSADGLRGSATLRSEGGGIRLATGTEREFVRYERLEVDAGLVGGDVEARLELRLAGDDFARGQISTGLAEDAPIDGSLSLSINDLTFVELFSPDVVDPQGELSGTLRVVGTRAQPAIDGEAGLRAFGVEIPALGIRLRDSDVVLRGDPSGEAVLDGTLRSGQGQIAVSGRMAPNAEGDRRLEIGLVGEDFLAADIPELRAVVSPRIDIVVEDALRVRGRVDIPSARIDLEQLETTTSPSSDVVVLDPVDPAGGPPMPIDALVTVALGDAVELIGFGLEGRLAGELRVREITGRSTTANGALDVSGSYTAYGQDLTLRRGRLGWASSAIENPSLDLEAQRSFDNNIIVGLRVRGTARQPTTEIFSEPAMDNTDALSWLVLGRPLRTASGEEGQQLGAAALALGAGGNLVAEQLGARLGLDEAGVSESRALGGATFSVGKYLSPRLLVSYGVSLLGSGQVLTLKYLLGRGFDIEVESGTESRAGLNWRFER